MEELQAEIQRKRKFLEGLSGGSSNKFVKNSDLNLPKVPSVTEDTNSVENANPNEVHHGDEIENSRDDNSSSDKLLDSSVSEKEEKDTLKEKDEYTSKRESLYAERNRLLSIPSNQTERITVASLKENKRKVLNLVLLFFTRLLNDWHRSFAEQENTSPISSVKKQTLLLIQNTRDTLKPFFRMLRDDTIPDDVIRNITQIVDMLQQREYIKANDIYLRLAIGNAPWPIGVTSVGIHERSAREKINANQVAHVLNDEVQRKWIQSVKRLITVCQKLYPPYIVSKSVG